MTVPYLRISCILTLKYTFRSVYIYINISLKLQQLKKPSKIQLSLPKTYEGRSLGTFSSIHEVLLTEHIATALLGNCF